MNSRLAKQLIHLTILLFVAGLPALAQEAAKGEPAGDHLTTWKLINTAIFAVLLGWFLAKNGPKFFNARSADIQKAIKDATGLKMDAEFRYSDIDKKMATLSDEVKKMREQSRIELEREHDRIRRQTDVERQRIEKNAGNEIEALRVEAAKLVQRHTAEIALGLAERRLQDRFAQGEPDTLVHDFVDLVERGKN